MHRSWFRCIFIYIYAMASRLKRDRVNRVTGLVYLPIDGSRMVKGSTVTLKNVEEADINCEIRDAMQMKEPVKGNAVGDAVFDAMASVDSVPVVLGDSADSMALGFGSGGISILLDTGYSSYSGGDVTNACDADLLD